MSNPKGEGPSFRPDIQGLRALCRLVRGVLPRPIAVLLRRVRRRGRVLRDLGLPHLRPPDARGGAEGAGSISRFYARRIRRLLPAALVVLVATVIAARIWLSPLEQLELVPSVLFSALYASNLLFAFKATDYLAGGVHSNLLLHTWSLSVEEQFYLMWPAVIVLGAYLAMKTRGRSSAPSGQGRSSPWPRYVFCRLALRCGP